MYKNGIPCKYTLLGDYFVSYDYRSFEPTPRLHDLKGINLAGDTDYNLILPKVKLPVAVSITSGMYVRVHSIDQLIARIYRDWLGGIACKISGGEKIENYLIYRSGQLIVKQVGRENRRVIFKGMETITCNGSFSEFIKEVENFWEAKIG